MAVKPRSTIRSARRRSAKPPRRAANDRLRVGVIGAGGIGRVHLQGWKQLQDAGEVEILCVGDIDREAADRRAADFNLPRAVYSADDVLAMTPDIVDVILPNRAHCAATVASLRAGCHTLCEKPLALNAKEIRKMIAAAQASGKLLMTAQHMRFEPESLALKQYIDTGAMGEVYYVHAHWLRRRAVPARPSFYQKRFAGGGPTIDLGVHMLDLLMWLVDNFEPVSVTGVTPRMLGHRKGLRGLWGPWDPARFDVEDFGSAFVRFANGLAIVVEVSWLSNISETESRRAMLLGTQSGVTYPELRISGEQYGNLIDSQLVHLPPGKGHQNELRAFCKAVRDGGPSPVPPTQSLQVARILEGWYRSHELGREVRLAKT